MIIKALRAGHSVVTRFGCSGVLFELVLGVNDKDDISSSLLDASSMAFVLSSTTIITSPDTLMLIIFTTILIASMGDVLSCFFAALTSSKDCQSNHTSIAMVHQHDILAFFFVMTQSFYQITQDTVWRCFVFWFQICATFKPKLKYWCFIFTSQHQANETHGRKNQKRDMGIENGKTFFGEDYPRC